MDINCSIALMVFSLLSFYFGSSTALFGSKNKKDEESQSLSAKDSIALGLSSLRESSQDPSFLKDTMKMMHDPATMREVERLMKDPAFVQEVEKLKANPVFLNAAQGAKDMYSNPETAARVQAQLIEAASELKQESDIDIGLRELAKAAKNPKMLADAMEMLKDPEIAKEVQAMMNDPSFQKQMKQYTDSPQFKSAMERSADGMDLLMRDPVKMKQLEAELSGALKSS